MSGNMRGEKRAVPSAKKKRPVKKPVKKSAAKTAKKPERNVVGPIFRGMTAFLRNRLLPRFPYFLMFWFGNKIGEAYRFAPGADVLKKIVYSMETLGDALASPLPSFEPFDLFTGAMCAGIICFVVAYRKKHSKKWRKDVEYGSARWGNAKDIEPYVDPKPDNNIILTATESLTLNGRPKNPKIDE